MINTPDTKSICPVFFQKTGVNYLKQVGSSVILQIKNKTFLLTVAHVADFLKHGDLFIPSKEGFQQLYGSYSTVKLPTGKKREHDKVDIAYFKLDVDVSRDIHPTIKALGRNDLHLSESLVENDIYTLSGYPLSKAKNRGKAYKSEIYSFTGPAAGFSMYEEFGYDFQFHIFVRFNRKQSCTTDGVKQMSPHPKGISGGAVFSWPKDFPNIKGHPKFHLVGIGHTYKENEKVFVGTRINAYLANIYNNNPKLIGMPLEEAKRSNKIPMYLGIAWYKKEEWGRLKNDFEDSEKMHTTWNEWRQATEAGMEYMLRINKIMYPITLEADFIKEYCLKNNMPNTSQTRTRIVGEILHSLISEKEIKKHT